MAQTDPESRYLQARAANELALAAFKRLEALADSPERRTVRATVARAEERYTDAIAELKAALAFAPDHPALLFELASAQTRRAITIGAVSTLAPLLQARPDDVGCSRWWGFRCSSCDVSTRPCRSSSVRSSVIRSIGAAAGAGSRVSLQRRSCAGHSADRARARRRPGRKPARATRPRLRRRRTERQGRLAPVTIAGDSTQADERAREAAKRTITPPK